MWTLPKGAVSNPRGAVSNPRCAVPNPRGAVPNPRGTVPNPRDTVPNLQPCFLTTSIRKKLKALPRCQDGNVKLVLGFFYI